MKVWTQREYDDTPRSAAGVELGTGDFRGIDFRGRHAVIIGPNSKLGEDVHLGVGCEIGARSEIGARFRAEGNLKVGKYCHFGEDANVDEIAIIDRGTSFATGVGIGEGTELGEDVSLPSLCTYLFDRRARNADGKSLIRLSPVAGRTICAFVADYEGERAALVAMRGMTLTAQEWETRTRELLELAQGEGNPKHLMDAQDLHAAALYIKEHFARRAASA